MYAGILRFQIDTPYTGSRHTLNHIILINYFAEGGITLGISNFRHFLVYFYIS